MAEQQKFYGQAEFSKGLAGVIACESTMGYVDGQAGELIYRGYSIFDLAEHSNFEETSYLLLFGKLPTQSELDDFKKKLVENRAVPGEVIDVLKLIAKDAHPMASLRTGVSVLGALDPNAEDQSIENYTNIGISLIAKMATLAGAVARIRKGQEPVDPDPSLDHTANFLYMMNGEKADDYTTKVMDCSLVLHADHGMNASTFSSIVVASSMSDMYSAITAGIASLKGPLHGGANEQVMHMFDEIGSVDKVDEYVDNAIANKQTIMGFGHRVYKAYDPRAKILGKYSEESGKIHGKEELYAMAKRMEEKVIAAYGEKGIFPNVDFYSGTIYTAFGIETLMFTPIFAVSRISGWAGRVIEYVSDNRIMRPRAIYTGPMKVDYVTIDKRG
jgi:citrate synthase